MDQTLGYKKLGSESLRNVFHDSIENLALTSATSAQHYVQFAKEALQKYADFSREFPEESQRAHNEAVQAILTAIVYIREAGKILISPELKRSPSRRILFEAAQLIVKAVRDLDSFAIGLFSREANESIHATMTEAQSIAQEIYLQSSVHDFPMNTYEPAERSTSWFDPNFHNIRLHEHVHELQKKGILVYIDPLLTSLTTQTGNPEQYFNPNFFLDVRDLFQENNNTECTREFPVEIGPWKIRFSLYFMRYYWYNIKTRQVQFETPFVASKYSDNIKYKSLYRIFDDITKYKHVVVRNYNLQTGQIEKKMIDSVTDWESVYPPLPV